MSNVSDILLQISIFISLYFEVFLLIAFFGKKEQKDANVSFGENNYPSITIAVPVWNEEKTVSKTIDSLLALDYPKDKLNICIVDDGSTDNTWDYIQTYKNNPQITLLRKENGGKHTAVNFAILHSQSEFIGCLDADSFVKPNTLKIIMSYFAKDEEVMAVTPSVKIYKPNNLIRHLQSNEYDFAVFNKEVQSRLGSIYVTPGPFSIYKAEVFKKIGNFKAAHNTEDMEIAMRMQKNHLKIMNARDAIVYTVGPETIQKLYKQRVRWTYGFIKNLIDYKNILFKKEHGHLGILFMPMSILSMVIAVFFFLKVLYQAGKFVFMKIIELNFFGLDWYIQKSNVSWFFVDTNTVSFLSILLLCTTVVLIIYGRFLSEKEIKPSIHTLLFPFIYPFVSIFWILTSVYNAVFSINTNWR